MGTAREREGQGGQDSVSDGEGGLGSVLDGEGGSPIILRLVGTLQNWQLQSNTCAIRKFAT
eukprot:2483541-Rhodomonas_salina.2